MEHKYNVYTYYRKSINGLIFEVNEWIEQKQEKEPKSS